MKYIFTVPEPKFNAVSHGKIKFGRFHSENMKMIILKPEVQKYVHGDSLNIALESNHKIIKISMIVHPTVTTIVNHI